MEDTSGFYKFADSEVLYAPNAVIGPGFELRRETHEQHTYPAQGWYWLEASPDSGVGVISSGAFVLRFLPAEYGDISSAAATDPIIAGFLARVTESTEVVLYSTEVQQGMAYLVSQSLLTQQRADEILAY